MTNSERKETRTQINNLEQKEEINFQPEQNEGTRIQKYEEWPRNLLDKFKCFKIQIIGVPEGEEEEKVIENLFAQMMKEIFCNLVKEIDFQEVQEGQGVLKKLDPRRNTPRHIIIKSPTFKDKERNLKAARGESYLQRKSMRLSADFSKETLQARRVWKEVFDVMKGKDLPSRLLYPSKLSFRMEGKVKCFPAKVKLKEIIITRPLLYEMLT